jgi:hypothetical protein
MMIELDDGSYILSGIVTQLQPHGRGTTLVGGAGNVLGHVARPPRHVAAMMAPVIPAEPGYEVVYLILDDNGRPTSHGSDPIIGWRVVAWLSQSEPAWPITVHMDFDGKTWAIFKDSKCLNGWMTPFDWFYANQKRHDDFAETLRPGAAVSAGRL